MMMRSPYRGRDIPEYYSAAEVQRAVEQLKHTAQTWQRRYEESQSTNERLRQKLTQLQNVVAEVAAWRENYEALQAQLDSQQEETPQIKVALPETEVETFILDVLPFLDNLERALQHAGDSPLNAGIALTLKEFTNSIARYGIQRISPEGQPFDPTIHEALGTVHHATLSAGTVAAVEQAGYKHGERLLRPARVMVVADDGEPR